MDAVPRLPMIMFPQKTSSKPAEFSETLKGFIRNYFNEDGDSFTNEIQELESLRRNAANASSDLIGCSTLKKYYSQLSFLSNRFKCDEASGLKLSFSWNSAFDMSSTSWGDIFYERNCVLYNLGSLHACLGTADPRTSAQGMKVACTHFQCASWAFQQLSECEPGQDPDFEASLMSAMSQLCLAQAQECILEKSIADGRKPNIIAKVAMQVVEYLRLTLKNLEAFKKSDAPAVGLVGSKILKSWQREIETKIHYYSAVALFQQGLSAEEQQSMGLRIAFFSAAVVKLEAATKEAKGIDKSKGLGEAFIFANDIMMGKLTASQKENEFVFHEKVPPEDELPVVKGASLVKGISFDPKDPDVAGKDLFRRLVPLEAHEDASLYSEEKAKILRHMTSQVQERDDDLASYLALLHLDEADFEHDSDVLPQELVECCADLNSRDAIGLLRLVLREIEAAYEDVARKISDTDAVIKGEEAKEKEFVLLMGGSSTSPKSPNLPLSEQRLELSKCAEAQRSAGASHEALKRALSQHEAAIGKLARPLKEVQEALPSPDKEESESDRAARTEVRRLVGKVRQMQSQRRDFEAQLRAALHADDVTSQLATTRAEDRDAFFAEQLGKHKPLVAVLEQNLRAQPNIVQAFAEATASFGVARRSRRQVRSAREAELGGLIAAHSALSAIERKADHAKQFYARLSAQLTKLLSRSKANAQVQDEQRQGRLAARVAAGEPARMSSLASSLGMTPSSGVAPGNRLKDYLMANPGGARAAALRPAPLGSEESHLRGTPLGAERGIGDISSGPSSLASVRGSPYPQASYSSPAPPYSYNTVTTSAYPAAPLSTHISSAPLSTHISSTPLSGPISLHSTLPSSSYGNPVSSAAPSVAYSNSYTPSTFSQYTADRSQVVSHAGGFPSSIATGPSAAQQNKLHNYSLNQYQINSSSQQPLPPSGYYSSASSSFGTNPASHPTLSAPSTSYYATTVNSSLPQMTSSFTAAPTETSQKSLQQWPQTSSVQASQQNAYSHPPYSTALRPQQPAYHQPVSVPTTAHTQTLQGPTGSISNYSQSQPYGGATYLPPSESQQQQQFQPYSALPQRQNVPPQQWNPAQAVPSAFHQPTYPAGAQPNTIAQTAPYQSPHSAVYSNASSVAQTRPYQSYYPPGSVSNTAGPTGPHQQTPFPPTPIQPQRPEPPKVQTASSDGGISNLDLLSGIDLSESAVASPLKPYNATTSFSCSFSSEATSNCSVSSVAETAHTNGINSEQSVQTPQVASTQSTAALNLNKLSKMRIAPSSHIDLLCDDATLRSLTAQTERFSRVVQQMARPGTALDGRVHKQTKWDELTQAIETECQKGRRTVSVGRCHPLKNRFADNLPFDESRVALPSSRDDYINASYVQLKCADDSMPMIVTQAPLHNTVADFWSMVWEAQCEVIVALNTDAEVKGELYLPPDGAAEATFGSVTVSVTQTSFEREGGEESWKRRTLKLIHVTSKVSRVVLHRQFLAWPPSSMPTSPSALLRLLSEVHQLYRQQRSHMRAVIVHCVAGTGRSGVVAALSAFVRHLDATGSLGDVFRLAVELSGQRRGAMQDSAHLLFLYTSALYYAQQVLMKRGILTDKATFDDGPGSDHMKKTHVRHPSADLLAADVGRIKTKLGLGDEATPPSTFVPPPTFEAQGEVVPTTPREVQSDLIKANKDHTAMSALRDLPPTLAASVDPALLVISAPRPKKITKDDFSTTTPQFGTATPPLDPNDPLCSLDPLWTIKKAS